MNQQNSAVGGVNLTLRRDSELHTREWGRSGAEVVVSRVSVPLAAVGTLGMLARGAGRTHTLTAGGGVSGLWRP